MNITENNRLDVVAFSGGKDSTAVLLHAIEVGVDFTAVFADTGNEHRLTYEYLDYIENKLKLKIIQVKADFSARMEKKREYIKKRWDKPLQVTRWGVKKTRRALTSEEIEEALTVIQPTGVPMLDLLLQKGMMPTPRQKFCSIELKQIPIHDQIFAPAIASGKHPICWQGVRAEESPSRSRYEPLEETDDGVVLYRPLLLWKHEDVFRIAKKHGIKHNPLYSQGMSRVGCMPCINCNGAELSEIGRRFPDEISRISEWEKLVALASRHPETREAGICEFLPFKSSKIKKKGIYEVVKACSNGKANKKWMTQDLYQKVFDPDSCSAVYPIVCE